ncbi:MAG TPA: acetyl-CoA carboxylase, carboxyltransferase subunit beta [Thermoanaerobaculia bacterium]|nr:acetyl-CoA carboxylase, carboxyltransferase subunit beta [Thermoanaerobaculia bacterium]
MPWFKKTKKPKPLQERPKSRVPEGLWVKCDRCKEIVYSRDLEENLKVCPSCGHHFRLDAGERLRLLLDGEPRRLFDAVSPVDPLHFTDTKRYRDRLRAYQEAVGERDAVIVAEGTLDGLEVVVAAMEYRFMGGSMGSVVGERIARAAESAADSGRPLIVVSASGGARMQEGVLSLMQMAKISAALARLRGAGQPYLSVLTDPTTGGVTASFAMLGDLNVAEPGALIGFAGPRVIEQTIRQQLPEGFQRSEFLLDHGFLDLVVPRVELKATLATCLRHLGG